MEWLLRNALLYVVLFLAVGSALKYVLPYAILGLTQVGLGKPWPRWEWRYLSAFALALIGYGLALMMTEDLVARFAAMRPPALVLLAYGANELARAVIKPLEELGFGQTRG
uniref:Uncharacterized protein n=1 Tax=viral metagenome TaxID=1070528 RepID=A0A6M3M3N7_9ZZZZ